ncbi:MAG: hypothetical protein WBR23_03155 [Candidatus Dormiibacterota bacterium]
MPLCEHPGDQFIFIQGPNQSDLLEACPRRRASDPDRPPVIVDRAQDELPTDSQFGSHSTGTPPLLHVEMKDLNRIGLSPVLSVAAAPSSHRHGQLGEPVPDHTLGQSEGRGDLSTGESAVDIKLP